MRGNVFDKFIQMVWSKICNNEKFDELDLWLDQKGEYPYFGLTKNEPCGPPLVLSKNEEKKLKAVFKMKE